MRPRYSSLVSRCAPVLLSYMMSLYRASSVPQIVYLSFRVSPIYFTMPLHGCGPRYSCTARKHSILSAWKMHASSVSIHHSHTALHSCRFFHCRIYLGNQKVRGCRGCVWFRVSRFRDDVCCNHFWKYILRNILEKSFRSIFIYNFSTFGEKFWLNVSLYIMILILIIFVRKKIKYVYILQTNVRWNIPRVQFAYYWDVISCELMQR